MKKLMLMFLIVILSLALIGCGGGADNTEVESEEPTNVEAETEEPSETEAVVEPEVYEDGVYEGEAEGFKPLKVSVEVTGGKIAKVAVIKHEETEGIADEAIEQIPSTIVEKNSVKVDAVSGATYTSDGIINAVKNALAGEPIEEEVSYKDGTYEGEGEGMYPLKVTVEVADGKIAKVEVTEHEETEGIADEALEQIPAGIVEKNSVKIDIISGATFTSEGIMNAVKNALENAKQ